MSVRITKSYHVSCTANGCQYSSQHDDFAAAIEAADAHINERTVWHTGVGPEEERWNNLYHELKIETVDLVREKNR